MDNEARIPCVSLDVPCAPKARELEVSHSILLVVRFASPSVRMLPERSPLLFSNTWSLLPLSTPPFSILAGFVPASLRLTTSGTAGSRVFETWSCASTDSFSPHTITVTPLLARILTTNASSFKGFGMRAAFFARIWDPRTYPGVRRPGGSGSCRLVSNLRAFLSWTVVLSAISGSQPVCVPPSRVIHISVQIRTFQP